MMPTPLYNRLIDTFKQAGFDLLNPVDRYKLGVRNVHQTIRSKEKARRIAHVLLRYGR